MFNVIGYTIFSHFYGYGFFGNTESAAKAAALILPVQRHQLHSFHHTQQLLRFGERRRHQFTHLRKGEATLTVTALVQSYFTGKTGCQLFYFEYICEEFGEFVDPFTYMSGCCFCCRIVQMIFDMQHTATGGAYNIVVVSKVFNEQAIALVRKMFVS